MTPGSSGAHSLFIVAPVCVPLEVTTGSSTAGVPLLSPQTELLCEHFVAWLLWRAWVLAPDFARSLCLYLIMLTGFTLVQVQALSRFLLFLFVSFLCVQTQADALSLRLYP